MLTGAILIRCLFVDGENKAMTGTGFSIIIGQGSGLSCSEATFTPNCAQSLSGTFPPGLNASDTAINIPNLSDTVDSNPRPPDYSEDLFTQLVTPSVSVLANDSSMPEPTGSTSVARAAVRLPIRSDPFKSIIGRSPCMLKLFQLMQKMLQYDWSVVITGESGTGKELVARALHQNGLRRSGPLVIVNCATLGGDLLQSTLFGHVRGSFTGASTPRKGLFEQADRGTIFLDELGEMDPDCQAMLLRVLEEGTFTPVGGNDEKQVDVRIIAATNRDLGAMVNAGTFRRDLFERLNRLSLRVPPLRERVDDIPLIVDHLLDRIVSSCQRSRKSIVQTAMTALQNRKWSGNIRELENVLGKAWVDSDPGNIIQIEHIPPEEQHGVSSEAGGVQQALQDGKTLEEYLAPFKRNFILAALNVTRMRISATADLLGINRNTLPVLMQKLSIRIPKT